MLSFRATPFTSLCFVIYCLCMSNYQLLQKGARSSDRTRQIMYKNALRAAWAEINVTNLDFNIRKIREKVGPNRKITGIIKADGYGHGSVKVADVLRANGVTSFGVATLSEAIRLRDAGFVSEEIIVIGLTPRPSPMPLQKLARS